MPSVQSVVRALKAVVPHRRMGVITIDQVVSGASNLVIILLVAHVLAPADFGRFTILFLIYTLAATAQRALIALPVLVHPEDADQAPGDVLGSGIAISLLMSLIGAVAAVAFWIGSAESAAGLLVLSALLPLLLVQDLGRYLSWAVGEPMRSLWLDLVWLALLVAGFAVLVLSPVEPTLTLCILAWAGSGAAAGAVVFLQGYAFRARSVNLSWLRRRWDFSWKYLLGAVSAQASVLAVVTVIAWFSTAAAVAAVRAVTLLTRPGYAVQVAVGQSMATDIARDRPGARALWAHVIRAVAITSFVAAGNVLLLFILPDPVGEAILGNVWPLAEPLLLPAGLQLLLAVLGSGTRDAMLGRREITLVTTIDVVASLVLVVAAGVGAVLADAEGVLWALVVAQVAMTLVWWGVFVARVRAGDPPVEEEAAEEAAAEEAAVPSADGVA